MQKMWCLDSEKRTWPVESTVQACTKPSGWSCYAIYSVWTKYVHTTNSSVKAM